MGHFTKAANCALVAAAILFWADAPSAFISKHHKTITDVALRDTALTRTINGHLLRFSRGAINEIIKANVDQDAGLIPCALGRSPSAPFGDSANHFDSEGLNVASQRVMERLDEANKALRRSPPQGSEARRYLGQVLHAIQDYYAHSNWVETQTGLDSRLGTSSFAAVSLATATCQPSPNTGDYVPFQGYTSGYWFGCDGKNDALLPPGKCYHGSNVFGYAGTNKDDTMDGVPGIMVSGTILGRTRTG